MLSSRATAPMRWRCLIFQRQTLEFWLRKGWCVDPVSAKSNRNDLWAVWSLASQSAARRASAAVSVLIVWGAEFFCKFFAQEKWQFCQSLKPIHNICDSTKQYTHFFFTQFTPNAMLGFTLSSFFQGFLLNNVFAPVWKALRPSSKSKLCWRNAAGTVW